MKKIENFEWLFKEFLKVMSGEPLLQIKIVSQQRQLKNLLTIFHQYCICQIINEFNICHIVNEFKEKGWVEVILKDFHECIWDRKQRRIRLGVEGIDRTSIG